MASMTDVIFLLLIFFMVTSTFIFPTALEVNLPQSSEQTALKPSKRVYLDSEETGRGSPLAQIADAPNLEVRRKGRSRDLMHLKSYQVDGRVLRTGSANFSVSGAVYQDNDLVVIDSPQAAARFRDNFERLWARPDNQRIGSR